MNHEPECPTGKDWYEMCECEILRSAYQRGREDAAGNLGAFIAKYYYHFAVEIVEPLLAAARGDSTKCIPKQSQSVSKGREDHE